MEGSGTEAALAAKSAAKLSFADIAGQLGCSENDAARIIFRRRAARSDEAAALAQALRQPPGAFDQFTSIPKVGSSRIADLGRSVLDKVVLAVIAGASLFFFQQSYLEDSKAAERASTLANITSESLKTQSSRLAEFYNDYLDSAVELQVSKSNQPDDHETVKRADAAEYKARLITSSLDVIEAVTGVAISGRVEFEATLGKMNSAFHRQSGQNDIAALIGPLTTSYAQTIKSVGAAIRGAVLRGCLEIV